MSRVRSSFSLRFTGPCAALALIAPGLLAGCTSYSAPTLEVTHASVKDRTPEALVLDFTIDATNRNRIELPLREMDYTVKLGGREVFSGTRSPEAALHRLGTQTIHLPAVVPLELEQTTLDPHYEIEGVLKYITPGQLAQVLFDIKVRRPKVRFSAQGELETLPATP